MASVGMGAWLITIGCALASYLICGIPFGLILGRMGSHVDIRQAGSGNIGTTNALRVAGPKVAALTLLLDCLKGVVCVCAGRAIIARLAFDGAAAAVEPGGAGDYLVGVVCLACICGHVFSPYLKFRGGKGIAVGVGILLAWYWPLGLLHLGIFIVIVAATRTVSLGSIITAALVPVTVCVFVPQASIALKVLMSLMALIAVWAHRSNIAKLAHGTESHLSFTKRADTRDGDR